MSTHVRSSIFSLCFVCTLLSSQETSTNSPILKINEHLSSESITLNFGSTKTLIMRTLNARLSLCCPHMLAYTIGASIILIALNEYITCSCQTFNCKLKIDHCFAFESVISLGFSCLQSVFKMQIRKKTRKLSCFVIGKK